ncbi:MAG: Fe-S cluster assembly protein SufD [Bacteroidota bacterium]
MSTVLEKNNLLLNFEEKFKPNVFNSEIDLIRKNSFEKFSAQGFPTKKSEEYKYIPVEKHLMVELSVEEQNFTKSNYKVSKTFETAIDLSIVNGNLQVENEIDTKQFYISTIQQAIKKHPELINQFYLKATTDSQDSFALLNNAFANDGCFIYIKKSAVIESPILLNHFVDANSTFINQRTLVVVEENAICTIYENIESANVATTIYNGVSEIFVNQNANLQHIKFEQSNKNLVVINNQETVQSKKSVASNFTITINGGLTRNNTCIRLNDEHIESHLYGVYVANNESIIDNHTLVDHRFPNCNSNELYKGIANDKATTVFNGKIFVRKDAQKTNAFQSNKNILMSDDATVNTKPQLEIYADDVKCSHGTSTGKLDENALFYLKARGIGELSAKKLLLQAFVNETCEPIQQEDIREYILNALHASIV